MVFDPELTDRVTAVVQHVIASLVLPSFRTLRPEDIHRKDTPGDPDDLVTIVDQTAERLLVDGLRDIVPGAAFIGEEAVAGNPALLAALSSAAPIWLIDPIDGTKNFARGDADFGVMLALVQDGATRASWMVVPAAEPALAVVARQGCGTLVNGSRVNMTRQAGLRPRGTVHTRMMPAESARAVVDALHGRYDQQPSTGAAATEYSAILRGEKDFAIYYRLLPWDHAPGALALTEAGGAAVHLGGEPYRPLSPHQVTIFAASVELGGTIRDWLTRGQDVPVSR